MVHNSENLRGKIFFDERSGDYGLGQQSSAVSGIRRYGGEAQVRIGEFTSERTGRKGERFLGAKLYREENLETGANRTVSEVEVQQESERFSAAIGLRRIVEETADDVKRRSLQFTSNARRTFQKAGLTLRGSREQTISGDEAILFPTRTTLGFDQRLFKNVRLSVDHEISEGPRLTALPRLLA